MPEQEKRRNVLTRDVAAHWKAIFEAATQYPRNPAYLINAVEKYVTFNMDCGYIEDKPDV